ncbi:unnamed protein product, partial [Didymodactylos carnosus]
TKWYRSTDNLIQFEGQLKPDMPDDTFAIQKLILNFLTNKSSDTHTICRLSLATILPLFQLELIGSLQFTSLRLVPSDIDTNVKLSGTITVKIDSPFGKKFPLNIQTLDMNTPLNFEHKQIETLNIADAAVQTLSPLSVTYQTTFNDVQIVASMKFNKQLVNHSLDNKLEMEFVSKPLTILDYHAFQQFSATLLFTPNVKVMINGSAEPIAITNMGILTLNNILIVDELSLIGFNQFQATNGLILLLKIPNLDILESN